MSTDPQTTILALPPAPADTAEASVEGRLAALERQQSVMFSQQAVIDHLEAQFDSAGPAGEPTGAEPPAFIRPASVSRRRPGIESTMKPEC